MPAGWRSRNFSAASQVRLVQLDPLAAQPDQGNLEPGQFGQLGGIDHLIADCYVVPEVHQVAEPEFRLGHRRASRRGLGPGGQLEPEPRLAHPVRQQHPEPGPGQQRPGLLQEPERARRVQLQHDRRRLAQRLLQLAEQPGGGAQPGQQLFGRVVAGPEALARPGVGGGDHQARVLGGLQRELDPPGTPVEAARPGGSRFAPGRLTRYPRAVQPRVQLRGQFRRLGLLLRRRHLEASIGAGQCRHVPFGQGNASRSTASPRGQERTGQAGARRGVGQVVERAGQQDARRVPGDRPARRGHGRSQVARPLHVGAAEHRAPAGHVTVVLDGQDRQHPAVRRQAVGEASQRGQVGQRGARDHELGQAGAEQVQRGGRGQGQHRHPPAGQPDPAGTRQVRPDQLGRGERPGAAGGRRQLQRELVVHRLAGRLTARPGQRGQHVGQLGTLAGERMRRRGRRAVARHGRQVWILGPQAERLARPYTMKDPHNLNGNKRVGQCAPRNADAVTPATGPGPWSPRRPVVGLVAVRGPGLRGDLAELLVHRAEQEDQDDAYPGHDQEAQDAGRHVVAGGGRRRGGGEDAEGHRLTISRIPANRSSSGSSVSTTDLAR